MTSNPDERERARQRRHAVSAIAALAASLVLAACVSDAPEEATQAPPHEGQQLLERGVRSYERRDYEAAATDFTQALAYFRSYDLADGVVRSRINLARIELDLGRPEAAHDHLAAARANADRAQDGDWSARLDLLDSSVAIELGELERAVQHIEPHLPDFGDDARVAGSAGTLSSEQLSFVANRVAVAFERGDGDRRQWLARLRNALAAQDAASPLLEGRLERFRARLAADDGDERLALERLDQAVRHYQRARHRAGIAAALEQSAGIHANRGEHERARNHLDRALYLHLSVRNARATRANLDKRLAWIEPQSSRRMALRAWMERLTTPEGVDWSALRDAVIEEPVRR